MFVPLDPIPFHNPVSTSQLTKHYHFPCNVATFNCILHAITVGAVPVPSLTTCSPYSFPFFMFGMSEKVSIILCG